MKIPSARLEQLKKAYSLTLKEQRELDRLYAFEKLVGNTGEESEFAEAVLSVVDSAKATSIYVVSGRKLTLTSELLQHKAAEFLQKPGNRLFFFYPRFSEPSSHEEIMWYQNTKKEMLETVEFIQSFSPHEVRKQISFCGVPVQSSNNNMLFQNTISLCGPYTSITVAGSATGHYVAGYIYVEGTIDRWILLNPEHAKRILDILQILLTTMCCNPDIIIESVA